MNKDLQIAKKTIQTEISALKKLSSSYTIIIVEHEMVKVISSKMIEDALIVKMA